MSDSESIIVKEAVPPTLNPIAPQKGPATAPLSVGTAGVPPRELVEKYFQRPSTTATSTPPPAPAPVPARKLPPPPGQPRTGMERAAGILRVALPFVQRMLPLLDGNVDATVSNMLTPQTPKALPQPTVNIVPLQEGLADLRVQQRALRDQVLEHNASLKRVEDHLQAVREATDRNTLEQQELLVDLKSVGGKVNVFAFIALALLGVSVILNVVLYLQIRHIIP